MNFHEAFHEAFLDELEKIAGVRRTEVLAAVDALIKDPIAKEHTRAWSRHAALNLGMAESQIAQALGRNKGKPWVKKPKEELKDAAASSFFAAAPPNHHTKVDMAGMMKDRSGRKTRHRDWFRWGRGDKVPEPSKMVKKRSRK